MMNSSLVWVRRCQVCHLGVFNFLQYAARPFNNVTMPRGLPCQVMNQAGVVIGMAWFNFRPGLRRTMRKAGNRGRQPHGERLAVPAMIALYLEKAINKDLDQYRFLKRLRRS